MPHFQGIRRFFRIDRGAVDVERDVDDELHFYFERSVQEFIAAGDPPDVARRKAEARFGDLRATRSRLTHMDRQRVESEQRAEWRESLWQDVRYSVRSLARSPAFTVAAVLTLGIGMGANTAIFSVVDGVLLRDSPFANLDRVAMVWETDRASGSTREPASIPDFRDFRERARTFDLVTAFMPLEVSLSMADEPERIAALAVSHDYFATVGLRLLAGRTFTADEDQPGGPRAAIISEDLWARLFARDPNVTGRTLALNEETWDVVGVARRGADFGVLQLLGAAAYQRGFADRGGRTRVDIWLPLRASTSAPRSNHPIFVAGRLAPAATFDLAQREMNGIAAELERLYPLENQARGVFVEPMADVVFGGVRRAMYVLVGAVAMVLLVACVNVANLQLVRATARSREVIIRTALGAGARRLAQHFVVEALVLAMAGAAVGVAVAFGAVHVLRVMAPASIPRAETMDVDGRALLFTGAVAVAIAIIVGLLPTLRAKRLDISATLHQSGGHGGSAGPARGTLNSSLVVAELALATALMIGAGLLVRSLERLQDVDPGFAPAGVLKAEFQLPDGRYPRNFERFPDWPERQRFQTEVLTRLAALPGVESAALATANPMDAGFTSSINVVGREAEAENWPEPSIRMVSASYFPTLRIPVLDGRSFDGTDGAQSTPVVILNAAARDRFFGERNPLGAQIFLWGTPRTVVGVVGNERFRGLSADAPPALYMPLPQAPTPSALFVRARGDAVSLAPLVRRVMREVDPQLALFGVEPLDATVRGTLAQRRYTMLVLAAFAIAALVLAGIGVHGVLSYALAQRTREFGVRVALGAEPRRVYALVLRDGARMIALGVGLGLAAALVLSQSMRALLFGVTPQDPVTFAGVALVLVAVAFLATWFPARRASRADPMLALRTD